MADAERTQRRAEGNRLTRLKVGNADLSPYANLRPTFDRRYRIANLVEKRRDILRFARSLPRGPKRNQLRQTAASLRTLLRNKGWLDVHSRTADGGNAPGRCRLDDLRAPLLRA